MRRIPRPAVNQGGLRPDCGRCFGLCCAGPAFSASADFAIDKPAGQPCPNLLGDFRCSVHDRLRAEGFRGCAAFDCFGAGQKVSQVTFGGRDWRSAPESAGQMFAAFEVMRQLHELLWHLAQARALVAARPLLAELGAAFRETERLTHGDAASLTRLDVAAHREAVNALLLRASELARASAAPWRDLRGGDLTGASLRGACLRGARLLAAVLRGADLTLADVTGADFRGADLAGADLAAGLFVSQAQLDAAHGDRRTRLPAARTRPAHWRP